MSLPTYEKLTDSGIPWVGRVPSHWEVWPLVRVAVERSELNIGMREENLLSLSYGRIVRKDIESNDGLLPQSFETYQIVHPGDTVLRLTDLQNDKRSLRSALVEERGIITSAYLALRPTGVSSKFLAYLLRAYDLTKVFYSMGGGLRQSMKFSDFKRMPLAIPTASEQRDIVAFLERETAKIDRLIIGQVELMKLLGEKRLAIISTAVTRGLSHQEVLKDSGVPYLGKVPAHWSVRRLKQIVRPGVSISYGIVQPGEPLEHGIPFVQTTNMSDGSFNLDQLQRTTEEIAAGFPRSKLLGGEVILGIRASIGAAYVVPPHLAGANLSRGVARIECSDEVTSEYLVHVLRSAPTMNYWGLSKQGSTFNEVSIETVRELVLAIPPLNEQRAIDEFLKSELAKLDALSAKVQATASLLKERRNALIIAAVNGQIDVRSADVERYSDKVELAL